VQLSEGAGTSGHIDLQKPAGEIEKAARKRIGLFDQALQRYTKSAPTIHRVHFYCTEGGARTGDSGTVFA
jgi:hypothetical protein